MTRGMPITKHNWLISDPNDIPRIIREAFHVATTGRPGPVLVDFPKDVANQMMDWYWPESIDLPGYKPTTKGHPKQIKDAARLVNEAKRPVIYAGGGILKARAAQARGRRPGGPMVGDGGLVIEERVKAVRSKKNKRSAPDISAWITQTRQWQEEFPLHFEQLEGGPLKPQYVIEKLRENTPDDC